MIRLRLREREREGGRDRNVYILLIDKMVDDTTVTCFMGLKKK